MGATSPSATFVWIPIWVKSDERHAGAFAIGVELSLSELNRAGKSPTRASGARSIRTYLLALVAGVAVPLFLLAAVLVEEYAAAQRRIIESQRLDVASNLTHLLDREFASATAALSVMAASPEIQAGFAGIPANYAAVAGRQKIGALVLSDRTGEEVASSQLAARPRRLASAAVAVAENRPVVSDVTGGSATENVAGRPVFTISVPVVRDGAPVQALSAEISLDRLAPLFEEAGLAPGWIAAIVDRRGVFAARSRAPETYLGRPAHPSVVAVATGEADAGTFENVTLDGTPVANTFRRSAAMGWTSVVAVPVALLREPLWSAAMWLAVLAIALGLLSVVLALAVGKRISGPVQAVGAAARALVGNRPLPPAESGIAELREVWTALSDAEGVARERARLVDELRRNAVEAQARKEELEALLDVLPAAVFIADDGEGAHVAGNRATYELLRVPVGSNVAKLAPTGAGPQNFEVRVGGKTLSSDELPMRRAALSGEPVLGVEMELVFPEGDRKFIYGSAQPMFDAGKRVRGTVGAFVEITARKKAEEHIAFLLREMSHRMSNLIAVVQSMAALSAQSATSMAAFQERFADRLRALGVAQNLLATQAWSGASLRQLVEQNVAAFAGDGGRFVIDGPEVSLLPEAAQSIGLALHELATNAVKYGSLSVPAGKVRIAWRHIGEGERHFLLLSWKEEGGPPVEPPTRKGFGQIVSGDMVAQALDARVDTDYAAEGFSWAVRLPSACLVAGLPEQNLPI